jgi:hypothetical protein
MPKRILFIEGNRDGTVGGSYFLLLDLVRGLDRSRYTPIVGFHRENYLMDQFRAAGAEVVLFDNLPPVDFGGLNGVCLLRHAFTPAICASRKSTWSISTIR